MSERRITEVILAMFLVASWMEIPSVCFGYEFTRQSTITQSY